MINTIEFYLGALIYVLSFLVGRALFKLVSSVELIPLVNNSILFIVVIGISVIQLFLVIKFIRSKLKKEVKIVFSVILIVCIMIWGAVGFILSIFEIKSNYPFQYKEKTYYYLNLGFPDPYYYIYEKDGFFTMKELSDHDVERIFTDSDQIVDIEAKSIVEGIIGGTVKLRETKYEDKREEESEIVGSTEEEETPQNKLNELSMEYATLIPNSSYAIVQVDKAMGRCQWFFVKIEENRMIYISEIPETSPRVEGRVDPQGVIYLKFEDIHGDVFKYQSTDNGLNWKRC